MQVVEKIEKKECKRIRHSKPHEKKNKFVPKQYKRIKMTLEDLHFQTSKLTTKQW